ncbi:hypothetical protein B9Z19DRAFT_1133579 [Tuber borchii]|uniref:Aldehyde oxidase/xanthine dehydrogenase second molybdopterin binding domain-containing protein n=1 Tax=Tuber borchii TaxID=42251 RepID=A0A2T6ZFJ3_TUBBO|nr:hypothetical protein B9Z19DRAFT_1133579 [Tuber borchii]
MSYPELQMGDHKRSLGFNFTQTVMGQLFTKNSLLVAKVMKQGLNCAAYGFAVEPLEIIFTSEISLNTVANASLTAGFSGSELNIMATQLGNYMDPLLMYFYFTQGAAISEVELDVLTGSHTVLRTYRKKDVSSSINPAID